MVADEVTEPMADTYEIVRGLPDKQSLLDLLDESFGNWGGEEFLSWKYDRQPVGEATGYHIIRDDELVGFRGIFKRTIEGTAESYDFHVCGDACVAKEHRGNGLYSRIRDSTESDIEQRGSDFCSLFTRKGHIPFEVGLDRGWNYRTLPLYLRVLSPANVISSYAHLVLDEDGAIAALLDKFGGLMTLKFGRDELPLNRILGTPPSDSRWSVPIPFPRRATTIAVELAGTDSIGDSLNRRLSIYRSASTDRTASGDRVASSDEAASTDRNAPTARSVPTDESGSTPQSRSTTQSASADGIDVIVEQSIDDDLLESIATLYDEVMTGYDLTFRREKDDLRHLFDHPQMLGVVTARRNESIVGVAPVALTETEDTLEAWVLDLIAIGDDVRDPLIAAVEDAATDRGADVVLLISDADPGSRWARIDKQVMMWTSYDVDTRLLENGSLFIGLYDVL